jgi:hypothetical protein
MEFSANKSTALHTSMTQLAVNIEKYYNLFIAPFDMLACFLPAYHVLKSA